MAKFCKHCGRPLADGEGCSCRSAGDLSEIIVKGKSVFYALLDRMGIGVPGPNSANHFESGQSIVPDIIQPNAGEIPIKQYEAATLRSRIRGQYVKGRLQITNKRLIFRSAGISYKGPIAQQYEHAIDEIAGIEIKKSNRVSPLNIFLSIVATLLISGAFEDWFSSFARQSHSSAAIVAVFLGIIATLLFFILNKKFWIKLIILCCGIGALMGTGELTNVTIGSLIAGIDTNFSDYFSVFLSVLWVLNVILVSLVPDLTLCVKTKGAGEAFNIRRKQRASLFKQEIEYTGFSEVVPAKDVYLIASEVGAIIDDIHTLGDSAIDKWKEK